MNPVLVAKVLMALFWKTFRLKRMVESSITWTDFQLATEPKSVLPGAMAISMFHLTACALKTLPSWNVTPLARCSVMDGLAGSLTISQEVARFGASEPSLLPEIKKSSTNCMAKLEVPLANQGAPIGAPGPVAEMYLRVAPYCGWPVAGAAAAGG